MFCARLRANEQNQALAAKKLEEEEREKERLLRLEEEREAKKVAADKRRRLAVETKRKSDMPQDPATAQEETEDKEGGTRASSLRKVGLPMREAQTGGLKQTAPPAR